MHLLTVLFSLCADYATCGTGQVQSPLDLRTSNSVFSSFSIDQAYDDQSQLEFFNNGHTVEVDYHDAVGDHFLESDNDDFDLLQFHFHTPSENTMDGGHADAEVHFVHQDGAGNLLVFGVLIDGGSDDCDFLDMLESHVPQDEDNEEHVDISDLLDALDIDDDMDLFTFPGSLTTPPCTEGVTWIVKAEILRCSNSQIDEFSSVLHGNSRPVQDRNGRTIQRNFAESSESMSYSSFSVSSSRSFSSSMSSSSSRSGSSSSDSSSAASVVAPVFTVVLCVLAALL